MINIIRLTLLIISLGSLMACQSKQKKATPSPSDRLQSQKIEQAFQWMGSEHFSKAAQIYDSLAMSSKDPDIRILALYNAGLAYKSIRICDTSLSRFRSVLADSFKKKQDYQAISLLEISLVYECLGQEDSSLSSLKDLEKKLNFLDNSQQIIYLARLSLAWSKQGNFTKAKEFQSLALAQTLKFEKGLKKSDSKEKLSRLFYLMGKSYVKKEHLVADAFINSFFYHQVFLLQSLFIQHEKWSVQAHKNLDQLFKKLILALNKTENKKKYKKSVEESLALGSSLIKNENKKSWINYYKVKSQKVQKLLSQTKQKTPTQTKSKSI